MVFLPQDDPNPARRQTQKDLYEYDYIKLPGFPMLKAVPPKDESYTKGKWVKTAVSLGLRLRANTGLQDLETFGKFQRVTFYFFLSLLIADPKRADDWKRLFKIFLPLFQFVIWIINRFRSADKKLPADPQQIINKTRVEQVFKAFPTVDPAAAQRLPHQPNKTTAVEKLSFSDYKPELQIYNDLFQIIYLPEISHYFQFDRAFAAQRVAGVNPLVIERVQTALPANFPLTEAAYQSVMGPDDSLAHAIAEGRLYLADYGILQDITPGQFPPDVTKYVYAPLALFAVPAGTGDQRSLKPVAIQCGQDSSKTPIFTPPPDGTPQSGQWDWLIAKTIVQIADGNYHELISHLGRTHLFLEAFAISTPRKLATNHPLYVLLTPHFTGTLFINDRALTGLIQDKGTVDQVLFGTLADSKQLSVKGAHGYPFSFNDSMLPHTLKARGVDDVSKLPDYPYRDDALLIWAAIHDWVSDYLSLYYKSDTDVQADTELQAWYSEITTPGETGGQITDFGELGEDGKFHLRSKNYLIEAITLIIFTGSAQHAAVNFPQATYLTYGPNMPLAGYQPAPSQPGASFADYLALLPSLAQAEAQMNMTYVLGSVYYTHLGEYPVSDEPNAPANYFSDPAVVPLLKNFQQRLQEIELTIEDRNAKRPTYYDTLLPNKIPQSINI